MLARSGLVLVLCGALLCGAAACASAAASPLSRAAMLMDKGQADEASRLLRDYLREHPQAVPERRLLIRVEAFRGQLGAAQSEVTQLSRQLGEHSPIPFVELGHVLEVSHRYDEALQAFD